MSEPTESTPPPQRPAGWGQAPNSPGLGQAPDGWRHDHEGADGVVQDPYGTLTADSRPAPSWQTPAPVESVPIAAAELPSVKVEEFKQHRPLLPAVVIGVVAALVLSVLLYLGTRPAPIPASSPSPTHATPAPPPTFTPGAPTSTVIHSDRFDGVWKITSVVWDSTGVTITTSIQLTSGSLAYSFGCLDYKTTLSYRQTDLGIDGTLGPGRVQAGQTAEGTVRFNKPHNDTLLLLSDDFGQQIGALAVAA